MSRFDVGLKIAHYKAFGAEPQGFDRIMPVNVIIGRNNSGKSSLVDLVGVASGKGDELTDFQRSGIAAEVLFYKKLTNLVDLAAFSAIGSSQAEKKHLREQLSQVTVRWKLHGPRSVDLDLEGRFDDWGSRQEQVRRNVTSVVHNAIPTVSPLKLKTFRRLRAERDIKPEAYDHRSDELSEKGEGFTNLVHRFIRDRKLERRVVEEKLRKSLNYIFEGEAHFRAILIQQDRDLAEVFLEEEEKGDIPLSQSGSGLQTVLLTLGFLDLLPALRNAQSNESGSGLKGWIFAFEELENNLHPALQRRLFWLIRERAVQQGATVFLTTHSPVVIDLFSRDDDAQIIHVIHDGAEATVMPVLTFPSRCGILDDLDVRASDLLQANVVIWVEGPTDRMYFNRWIELWSEGQLREGKDYQCVSYGGRLLNHLTAEEPGTTQREAIEILRVNRNAIVLMDSDKSYLRESIGASKKRMKTEVEDNGGLAWITKGREVEHYVPHSVFRRHLGDVQKLEPYDDVLDYLNEAEGKGRKKYDKVRLAESLIPHMAREDLDGHLDLAERLDEVCDKIREWNRKPAPAPRPVEGEGDQ